MKKILVAIDFTKGSRKALKYALWFSKISKAELIMVWVDNQTVQQGLLSSFHSFAPRGKKQVGGFSQKVCKLQTSSDILQVAKRKSL